MLGRGQQFGLEAPLKAKALGYEFTHKSFFEYFVAKYLFLWGDKNHATIVTDALMRLNTRSLQEEWEILVFVVEGCQAQSQQAFTEPLFDVVLASRQDATKVQAASNAATLLNAMRVNFGGRDLSGVQIQGANLSNAMLNHTSFSYANLENVSLRGSFLYGTNLTHANLARASFGELPTLPLKFDVNFITYSSDGHYLVVGNGNKGVQLYFD